MQSLRKRPTYNEVVNYLENEQPKIKYPDRTATFLRNSPYLSQFDGDSWIDLEEQEQAMNKEKIKQITLRELAASRGETHQMLSARTQRYSIASSASSSPRAPKNRRALSWSSGYDSAVQDYLEDIEQAQQEREESRTGVLSRGRDMISRMLGQTEEQVARPEFLPQSQSTQGSLPPLEDVSSSSTAMPHGLNPVPLPPEARRRSTTRTGTRRETDDPEGLPRGRSRASSRPPQAKAEPKPKGRPKKDK